MVVQRRGLPYCKEVLELSPTNSLVASFVILGLWLVGLIAINLWLFQRQDIA